MIKNRIIKLIFLCIAFSYQVKGQVLYPDEYTSDYYDLLLFRNADVMIQPIVIHPSIIYEYSTDTTLNWDIWNGKFKTLYKDKKGLNINILNPQISYNYNSEYPRGYNDGPIWNGRGSNAYVTAGFTGSIGILHFSVAPILSYAQNQSFFIPTDVINYDKSEFSYPFEGKIDWVQRYGDETYTNSHLGQSEIRLIYKNLTVGFSTANLSWGPSKYNPILLSKNAGGFPHIDFGTAKPAKTRIGNIEFKTYWGMLTESDYFDDTPITDRQYITGFTFGYEPKYLKGLSLGLSRIMYARWAEGDLSKSEIFAAFNKNSHNDDAKNDDYDQMASVSLRYAAPKAGIEIYIEYARNDFPGNFNDLYEHPDRSRARTIGLTKVIDLKSKNILKFVYENTVLSANQTQIVWPSGSPTYYVHSFVQNGYTHRGQLLGAGIGPGSNSDIIKSYLYRPNDRFGLQFQRIRFNDDYFVNAHAREVGFPTDYEMTFGADYVKFFNNFSIQPKFIASYRKNMYYIDEFGYWNWHASLKVSYLIN